MNDFRIDSFEKVFAASLDEIEEIDKNFPELSDNQRLRAQQLLCLLYTSDAADE